MFNHKTFSVLVLQIFYGSKVTIIISMECLICLEMANNYNEKQRFTVLALNKYAVIVSN